MLFYKRYGIRRFKPSVYTGGHPTSQYTDEVFYADVQTLQNTSTTSDSGAESKQRVKVFSKDKIQIADNDKGIRADWLYFQGKWFEAMSCRLSENTLLKHYTSEFEEIVHGEFKEYLKPPTVDKKKSEGEEAEVGGLE